jgi:hypothetical protein
MANKTIGQLEESNFLDGNDFVALYNAEPTADNITYKARLNDVLSLKYVSVNGKTGSTITVNADDISDISTTKKFVTTTEKSKIGLIQSGLGGDVFLSGDGNYKSIALQATYSGASVSNVTVGGLTAGSSVAGLKIGEIIEKMIFTYQSPSFSSFSIVGQSQLIEVGTALSGNKSFTWSTSNSSNVQPNSIRLRNVTSNGLIASGLTNDGNETVNIGMIPNTAPINQVFRAEGINTNGVQFNSGTVTILSLYPYFYGRSVTQPTVNNALITGGTKVVSFSTDTLPITFNANSEYVWFAHPASNPSKSVWYVSALNNGAIGGGSNLFGTLSTLSVSNVNWNGITYKVYVSNYPTTTSGVMELRN